MPSSQDQPALKVIELGKRFGAHWVLAHLNLQIENGETIALFGDNGSGKSTLFKIIATLLEPSCGSLFVFGHDSRRARGAIRTQLRLLGHEKQLYDSLSVRENINLSAALLGLDRKSPRIEEALQTLEMDHCQKKLAHEISEGMKKRLALAKILLGSATDQARLIILDEPHAGLDTRGKEILHSLFRRWRDEKKTILLASHDHELILPHVDRVLTLKQGCITRPVESRRWRDDYGIGSTERSEVDT